MVVLGFRHGFDWDHIAAITDITSTTTASHADDDVRAIAPMPPHGHEHAPIAHASQYGPRTAFGVGMIHGVGAETGSQALLLAGVAGVSGAQGVVILGAFIAGLLVSNTLVAVTSATGFIGAQRLRTLYVIVGGVAGISSLAIGLFFIAGLGTALPDLHELLFGHRCRPSVRGTGLAA